MGIADQRREIARGLEDSVKVLNNFVASCSVKESQPTRRMIRKKKTLIEFITLKL